MGEPVILGSGIVSLLIVVLLVLVLVGRVSVRDGVVMLLIVLFVAWLLARNL